MQNRLIDPVTNLTFDLLTPKAYYFEYIPRSFPTPSLNTLGSFVFDRVMLRTNRQTDKQTDGLERLTHADQLVGVANQNCKVCSTGIWFIISVSLYSCLSQILSTYLSRIILFRAYTAIYYWGQRCRYSFYSLAGADFSVFAPSG